MHKKIVVSVVLVSLVFLVALILWGPSFGGESPKGVTLSVAHAKGVTEVPLKPERVAVLDLGVVDIMSSLGAKVAGVPREGKGGRSGLPTRLAQYDSDEYVNIGGLKEPNFEALSNLKPDLIIVSGRGEKAYDELSKLAPTILLTQDKQNIAQSLKDTAKLLGVIFGKEEKAEEIVADFEKNVDKARGLAQGKTALAVLTTGGKISAFGPKSRFGFLYDVIGFQSVYDETRVDTHGNVVSPEFILSMDPEWIFVVDRDAAINRADNSDAAKAIMDNPLIEKTKAHAAGQIVYLDGPALYLMASIKTFNDLTKKVIEVLSR